MNTTMQMRPILAALRRHKMATLLIVLQIALTLAVVSNALFIVKTRIVHLSRPTGTDEAHLFLIRNEWIGQPDTPHIDAQMRADLTTLRNLSGVRDAFASQAYPFGGWGGLALIKRQLEQTAKPQLAISYFADQHALDTFGISLVAGRNFRADEIVSLGLYDTSRPSVIIITRDLAHKLFPDGTAVGRHVYLTDDGPSTIVGVVDRLEGAYVGSTTRSIDEDTILVPARYASPDGVVYLVRAQPGQLAALLRAAPAALVAQNRMRLISPEDGVITLAQARARGYATDRGVAIMMAAVCVLLLLATAGGIVGLSSFWVGQRRRSIGVRRALGATRGDILCYFQTENALIVGIGVVLGVLLSVAANLSLMTRYELPRMPLWVLAVGAVLLWLLGQLAVLGPARRAAAVPPVEATRSG
ncbi:FtsX-like permease family protein [Rhodanobacter sp. T12-5]|uniref:ABC transporter permease n=1 Tax=Rhodanobacter sp. T12-5 TaxID=2024611 RepID=UPI0011EF7AE2|nr:FtsX-like permease family protein [Rhodanobacter sp. T12-5]KAA0071197.1 peptide ABC transporter permease [Rhodanobacter sp. T12-5]